MLHLLPTLLFLFLPSSLVIAGDVQEGGTCSVNNNRLQIGTYEFYSDCNSLTFCNPSTGKCEKKGCRRNEFPLGYLPGTKLPPRCDQGQFCPDEGDSCQTKLPVGSDCQLNRDGTVVSHPRCRHRSHTAGRLDQCQPPPNAKELADSSAHGLNVDGAVCLNFQCM